MANDCLNPDYCGTGDSNTICDNCKKKQWPLSLLDDMEARKQLIIDFNKLHKEHEFLIRQYKILANLIHSKHWIEENPIFDKCATEICRAMTRTLEMIK